MWIPIPVPDPLSEEQMIADGRDRYRARRERMKPTNTAVGRTLLAAAMKKMLPAVRAAVKKAMKGNAGSHNREVATMLKEIRPSVAAGVACRMIVDVLSEQVKLRELADMVGRQLDDERRFTRLKKEHPERWMELEADPQKGRGWLLYDAHGILCPPMARTVRHGVGLALIELFARETGLCDIETQWTGWHRKATFVLANPDTIRWAQKAHSSHESLDPIRRPILETPKDWVSPFEGGYRKIANPFARQRDFRRTKFPGKKIPNTVATAVNHVQRVSWRVNVNVARVAELAWEAGLRIGHMVHREDEVVEPKAEGLSEDDERAWKFGARRIHKRNHVARCRRMLALTVFARLRDLVGRDFYYPWNCDFRGRVYPIPSVVTPQGTEFARSMLEFGKGKVLTAPGVEVLKIWGRSAWGAGLDLPQAKVASIVADPLGHREWTHAKEPWLFLAWCFEWARFEREGLSMTTHLPCWIDGSANALQCCALLLRDADLAAKTNVLDGPVKQDPYQQLADKTWELLHREPDGHPVWQWATIFPDGFDRQTVKEPGMVITYGGGIGSVERSVVRWLTRTLEPGLMLRAHRTRSTVRLAQLIWLAFRECFPRFYELRTWLRKVGGEAAKAGLVPRWTSPSGFPIDSGYLISHKRTIRTTLSGKVRTLALREFEEGKLDAKLCAQSMPSNLVHGLDASAMHFCLADLARQDLAVAPVHDALGMLACDMPAGHKAIREGYAKAFQNDELTRLWEGLGCVGPQPPVPGKLSTDCVLEARHFFS